MKFIFKILIILILSSVSVYSFGSTINDDLSKILPKEILEEQAKSGKTILVYCYTSWCKPCMKMSKDVFSNKDVKAYMKENIILHRVDMESEEGVVLSKIYNVTTYPTFLIFRNGTMINKFIGAYEPDAFLRKLKERATIKMVPVKSIGK